MGSSGTFRPTVLLLICMACLSSGMKVHVPPHLRLSRLSQQAVDAVRKLWRGEDLNPEETANLDGEITFQRMDLSKVKAPVRRPPKKLNIVILGPFDSGTNLLYHTLRINFHRRVCGLDQEPPANSSDHEHLPVRSTALVAAGCGPGPISRIWKHGVNMSSEFFDGRAQPLETAVKNRKMRPQDTVVLAMVRSPLAQIAAWQLFAYDIWPCINRSVAEYNQPCSVPGMTWDYSGLQDKSVNTTFTSTMEVYNRYLRMYWQLKESGKFHDVVISTYEDLVSSPGDVVANAAAALGWPLPEQVAILGIPAKKHGHWVGREEAMRRNLDRWWVSQFSDEARSLVCEGLDPKLYRNLSENTFGAYGYPVLAYGADCSGQSSGLAQPGMAV